MSGLLDDLLKIDTDDQQDTKDQTTEKRHKEYIEYGSDFDRFVEEK